MEAGARVDVRVPGADVLCADGVLWPTGSHDLGSNACVSWDQLLSQLIRYRSLYRQERELGLSVRWWCWDVDRGRGRADQAHRVGQPVVDLSFQYHPGASAQ